MSMTLILSTFRVLYQPITFITAPLGLMSWHSSCSLGMWRPCKSKEAAKLCRREIMKCALEWGLWHKLGKRDWLKMVPWLCVFSSTYCATPPS